MYHDNIQEYVSQAAAANFNQANSGYRPPMVSNQIRPPGFPPVQNPHANIAHQGPAPQTHGVSKTDFERYVTANDSVLEQHNQASTSGSGTLPGNTITNPKEDLKVTLCKKDAKARLIAVESYCSKKFELMFETKRDVVLSGKKLYTSQKRATVDLLWGHYGAELHSKKNLDSGFYWPPSTRMPKTIVTLCDICQRQGENYANVMRCHKTPSQDFCDIFDICGIDIMGTVPRLSMREQLQTMAVEYFTKWFLSKSAPTESALVMV
ncbi:hypothetical protein Tco_0820448 [Tanacetum coccineum]|uniref:Uncharacterized protein n=1 Tax=Tanacetum coccineum TaxID=301880 RepID=A0ABQ5ADR0_9ASTR